MDVDVAKTESLNERGVGVMTSRKSEQGLVVVTVVSVMAVMGVGSAEAQGYRPGVRVVGGGRPMVAGPSMSIGARPPGMWVPYPQSWPAPRADASVMEVSSARWTDPAGRPLLGRGLDQTGRPLPLDRQYVANPRVPSYAGPIINPGFAGGQPGYETQGTVAPDLMYYFGTYGNSTYFYAPGQPSYGPYAAPGVSGSGTPVYSVTYQLPGSPTLSQGNVGNPNFVTPTTFAQPSYGNNRAFYGQGLNNFAVPGQVSYGQSTQAAMTPPNYFGNILPSTNIVNYGTGTTPTP